MAGLFCSFCGKNELCCSHLIKGETIHLSLEARIDSSDPDTVYRAAPPLSIPVCICDECVPVCAEMLAKNKDEAAVTAPSQENHKEGSLCG